MTEAEEFCHEHGLVQPITDFDSDVARCPICSHATSTTQEEAERFAKQDK